jgi:hypothetical protein
MMFRARKRPMVSYHSSNGEPAWNGWTSSLLDTVNKRESLELYMASMCITWNFDAARFSDAIHLEELDLETRQEMPGIASDPPIRFRVDTPYPEIEASLQGKAIQGEIACEIKILQAPRKYPLASVAERGLAGFISISATDFIAVGNKGKEFRTPTILVQINQDVDCHLLNGLRNSFRATRTRQNKPRLRVFLAKPFDVSVESLMENEGAETGIKQVILWEMWE